MKRKLESGFKVKFYRRRVRFPLMGPPRFLKLSEFVQGLAAIFQVLPRASKRLLNFTAVVVILIILLSQYLGSVQRATGYIFKQLSGSNLPVADGLRNWAALGAPPANPFRWIASD